MAQRQLTLALALAPALALTLTLAPTLTKRPANHAAPTLPQYVLPSLSTLVPSPFLK